MSNIPNDLVQCDIDTALALYMKGYTHIPILKRDGFSQDWSSLQPLYLDDLLDGVMAFCSDSKRESLLNPPVTDIGHVKEEIYLEAEKPAPAPTESLADAFTDDTDDADDDPDWVEDEPQKAEEIPEEDEVPTISKVTEETDSTNSLEEAKTASIMHTIDCINAGMETPWAWNVKEAIRLHERLGISKNKLTVLYGLAYNTITKRINEYKAKS